METPTTSIIDWLNSHPRGFEAHQTVPRNRPGRFQTVEQTGYRITDLIETAKIAIQAWAPSWDAAEGDAWAVVNAVITGDTMPSGVRTMRVESVYKFPSADGIPRWQATVEVTGSFRKESK